MAVIGQCGLPNHFHGLILDLHAAELFPVKVTDVTIFRAQKAFIGRRIAERGLGDRVEIRLRDYRDVRDGPLDAVASLEMGEHVGQENHGTSRSALSGTSGPVAGCRSSRCHGRSPGTTASGATGTRPSP